MNSDKMITEILKRIRKLEETARRGETTFPVFDLSSENTPAQITANQNNYDPGSYDVLRLTSDASRTITGLVGGMKGRRLTLWNVGSYNIVLAHQSSSSLAVNRIMSSTGANVTLSPNNKKELYYDFTTERWRLA